MHSCEVRALSPSWQTEMKDEKNLSPGHPPMRRAARSSTESKSLLWSLCASNKLLLNEATEVLVSPVVAAYFD